MTDATFDRRRERVATGVPGLDAVLLGGLLRQAVYMVRGKPGAGKTILANQLCFTHAAAGGRVLYVTLLSETHERMLFNLGQLAFFDASLIASQISYISAYSILEQGGLRALSEMLRKETRASECSLLVIDGLVTVEEASGASTDFKKFIHDMQIYASLRAATVVLLSSARTDVEGAEHTMVDGVLEVRDNRVGKRRERELEVTKYRGSDYLYGGHTFQITSQGIELFPRLEAVLRDPAPIDACELTRVPTGIPSLDEALHGGLRKASSTVLFGPSGTGKTTLGLHFLNECSREEPGLLFGFYETPQRILGKAKVLGLDLERKIEEGALQISWQAPTERALDALGNRLVNELREHRIKRLFVDGVDSFARAAADEKRIPQFFSALTNQLRMQGVTALYTQELRELFDDHVTLPIEGISSLVENILLLRFSENEARLRRLFTVVKLRDSEYDATLREFVISSKHTRLSVLSPAQGASARRRWQRLFRGSR